VKKNLKVGQVTVEKTGMVNYLVRNIGHLKEVILPIFDKYPLLTRKEFSYNQFKKCLAIAEDKNMSQDEKIKAILLEKLNKYHTTFEASS